MTTTDGGSAAGLAVGGASAGEGGSTRAGSGGAAGTVGGVTSAGGTAGAGGEAGFVSGGESGDAGEGGTTGGESGATSGAGGAVGGESGAGGGTCVDVCALHGAACCIPELDCVPASTGCRVEVFAEEVGVIYDYAALEQRIAEIPQDLMASFTDADIASAAADPAPAARMEFRMTPATTATYGAALVAAHTQPFRLSCNGQPLFVGVLYPFGGAAAIGTPVLHAHLEAEGGSLILRLGAWQGAWMGVGGNDLEARERIDRPELRAVLCARSGLRELEAP